MSTFFTRRAAALVACAGLAFGLPSVVAQRVHAAAPEAAATSTIDLGNGASLRLGTLPGEAGPVEAFSFKRAGQDWSPWRPAMTTINLRYGAMDPAQGLPALPKGLAQPATGDGAYIVQLRSIALPEITGQMRALGAMDATFLPYASYIVRLSEESRVQLAAQPWVRTITRFQPAFKLDESILLERFGWSVAKNAPSPRSASIPAGEKRIYNVMTLARGAAQQDLVSAAVAAAGGKALVTDAQGFIVRVEADAGAIAALAAMPEVLFIDPWGPAEEDMDEQRIMGGANYVEGLTGFSGQGVRGEVMDGGIRVTHGGYASPPIIHGPAISNASHGTNCYGIIFGTGVINAQARGMVPSATGFFAGYTTISNGTRSRYTHTQELLAPPYECVFQSNSWGSTTTTAYNSTSAQMDDILFLHDVLICQSQSNTGNQTSRPQAWAKNIVSVGGVRTLNTVSLTDDSWSGASIGPAADGRLKPDLSNSYDNVLTTTSTSDTAYTSTFNGTSAATPITAGHFGVFFQMWSEGLFGNTVTPGAGVFANRPRASTAKAMMINTARQYAFTGTAANLSRYKQGWGFPDLKSLYDMRSRMLIVNEEHRLTVGQTWSTTVEKGTDGAPLRFTLVYKDYQGTVPSTVHRINDLTLRITAPGGAATYWGNNGLAAGNWSTAGGAANDRDTVENVMIQNPTPGIWTIEVIASEINQDTDTSTPGADAAFALVASGLSKAPCSIADIASEGPAGLAGGSDGFITGADFDGFVVAFFNLTTNAAGKLIADLTDGTGSGPPDLLLTGADFDAFVAAFFAGCAS